MVFFGKYGKVVVTCSVNEIINGVRIFTLKGVSTYVGDTCHLFTYQEQAKVIIEGLDYVTKIDSDITRKDFI